MPTPGMSGVQGKENHQLFFRARMPFVRAKEGCRMIFEEFLFLCGMCITLGLCMAFGGLLGFAVFAWFKSVFTNAK
jgi:hypothetical protein